MKRTACRNGGKGREKGEREGGEGGRALDPVRPFPPLLLFFRGHDFRGDYRTLGQVRSALSSTPFVALTATAPPRVRDDIAASLGLRLGAGDAGRHVLSFERPNLHLAVCKRPPGAPRASACSFSSNAAARASSALWSFMRTGRGLENSE